MKVEVTQDEELAQLVRQKLVENEGYCPCKLLKIPENKCMCQDFINQTELGSCHCGLYIKKEL